MARCRFGSLLYLFSSGPRQRPLLLRGRSPNKVLLRGPPQGHPGSRYAHHSAKLQSMQTRSQKEYELTNQFSSDEQANSKLK